MARHRFAAAHKSHSARVKAGYLVARVAELAVNTVNAITFIKWYKPCQAFTGGPRSCLVLRRCKGARTWVA